MSQTATQQVEHRSGTFPAEMGWTSTIRPGFHPAGSRAALINLHGLGDHSGLYPSIAAHFPVRGIAVYAFDMRGNGRSPGQRAYLGRWDEYRSDLHAFIRQSADLGTGLPDLRTGAQSRWPGHTRLRAPLPSRAERCHCLGAAFGKVGVPPLLMALGRIMSRIWPRFSLEVGMDLSGLARDPTVIQTVLSDPLFHRRGTARLSTEVTATIARVQARAGDLAVPLLMLTDRLIAWFRRMVAGIFFRKCVIPYGNSGSIPAPTTASLRIGITSGCWATWSAG